MKPELKYGLIGGAGMICWMLGEYALGLHTTRFTLGEYTNWGPEVILFVTLWRLLDVKLTSLNRYWLPVWEGVLYGVLASCVAGLVFYIFLTVYINLINPEWIDLHLEWQVARMRAAGETEETVRALVRSIRWMAGPVGLAVLTVGLYPLLGGAASAVLTLWLNWRRKEPAPVS